MDGFEDMEELAVEAEDGAQRSTLLNKGVLMSTFPTRMASSSKPPLPVKKSVFKKPPHHA